MKQLLALLIVLTSLQALAIDQKLDHKLECRYGTNEANQPFISIGKNTITYNNYERRDLKLQACINELEKCYISIGEYYSYEFFRELLDGGKKVYNAKCGDYYTDNLNQFSKKAARDSISNFILRMLTFKSNI